MPADRFLHPKLGHSEKVSGLTSDQFRVWVQYILSADDFGVMRYSAITLRDQNAYLAGKPEKLVQKWLDALVTVGLIHTFDHQGRGYVFQHDWQTWQKVEYPRATIQPMPPADALALCDEVTALLFSLHPGGKGEKFAWPRKKSPNRLEMSSNESEMSPTNAGAHARVVANGNRLVANGFLGGGQGEPDPPMDVWFRELCEQYPEARVTRGARTEQAFVQALSGASGGPSAGWALMCANLALNLTSHEWRVKRMVPKLETYLLDGRWLNVLPADAPVAEQLTSRTQRTLDAAAKLMKETA